MPHGETMRARRAAHRGLQSTPHRISLVNLKDRTRWYSYTCSIFHIVWCCSASCSSHSSQWLDAGRANRQPSSRLFELSSHSSAKADFSNIVLSHQSLSSSTFFSGTAPRGHRQNSKGHIFLLFSKLLSHWVGEGWELTAHIYIWKSTGAPVDRGTLKNGQSCGHEVWRGARFGGQQALGGEEQVELCRVTSEQFHRRTEPRPAAVSGHHSNQLYCRIQKMWVRI